VYAKRANEQLPINKAAGKGNKPVSRFDWRDVHFANGHFSFAPSLFPYCLPKTKLKEVG
jgi:hypothetical protein